MYSMYSTISLWCVLGKLYYIIYYKSDHGKGKTEGWVCDCGQNQNLVVYLNE